MIHVLFFVRLLLGHGFKIVKGGGYLLWVLVLLNMHLTYSTYELLKLKRYKKLTVWYWCLDILAYSYTLALILLKKGCFLGYEIKDKPLVLQGCYLLGVSIYLFTISVKLKIVTGVKKGTKNKG